MKTELGKKIDKSIALLKRAERLALQMSPDDGAIVGFSGGKDSQVCLQLSIMAGIKHKAVYNVTTLDAPDNVYFIREHYPNVEFKLPEQNFFHLIAKNGLPNRLRRFCCRILKENVGAGHVTITGIRHEESKSRAAYTDAAVFHKKTKQQKSFSDMERAQFECVSGEDKIMIYPILEWSEKDVWDFIEAYHLPKNPLYDAVGRVGCMFCPFAKKAQLKYYREHYPRYFFKMLDWLDIYIRTHETPFFDAEECYDWWESKLSVSQYFERASKEGGSLCL